MELFSIKERRGIKALTAESDVVEVSRGLDGLNLSTDIVLLNFVAEVGNGGMRWVVSAEDLDGLLHLVWTIDIVDCKSEAMKFESFNGQLSAYQ